MAMPRRPTKSECTQRAIGRDQAAAYLRRMAKRFVGDELVRNLIACAVTLELGQTIEAQAERPLPSGTTLQLIDGGLGPEGDS